MVYKNDDIAFAVTSLNFLSWIDSNLSKNLVPWFQSDEKKQEIANEFKKQFSSLDYYNNNDTYKGTNLIWYQDKKNIRKFAVETRKKHVNNRLSMFFECLGIYQIFYSPNNFHGDDILSLLPINPNGIICWQSPFTHAYGVYYETELVGYNLAIESLLPYWTSYTGVVEEAYLSDGKIRLKGYNRTNSGRFYYTDFNYKAYFDLLTGEIIIDWQEIEKDSYK
jgi:hypothetical protein